jgi:hypothetical protein
MKRIHLLIGAGVLTLLFAAGWLLFPKLFREVTDELPLPPTGEAAYNPLYALKLTLLAHGDAVSSWPNLAAATRQLGRRDALLLYDRPEAMTQPQAMHLLEWVRAGGHLVMPGPSSVGTPGPLAAALGLRAVEPPEEVKPSKGDDLFSGCDVLNVPTAPATAKKPVGIYLCEPRFLATLPGFQMSGGDERRGYRFARRALGEGMVTVAQVDYLDNEGLRADVPAARELAYQLLAPSFGRGRFHLVYSAEVPSLFRLLVDNAWMVLLPLVLALAAWLALRGQRFGSLQPAPEPRRRALLEHVHASGEFAWRRHRAAALHAAVLRLFQQRMQRRAPELFALSGEAQGKAIADATKLSPARVREALRPQGLQHPNAYTQSIATLLLMRSRL